MKTLIIIFTVFLLFIFNGCSSSEILEMTPTVMNFECDFIFDNESLEGSMHVDNDGTVTLSILKPDNINGTKLSVDELYLTIDTLGLTKQFDKTNVPEYSAITYIYDALDSAKNQHLIQQDDDITIKSTSDSGQYVIHFDNLANPTIIELCDINKTVLLKNVIKNK